MTSSSDAPVRIFVSHVTDDYLLASQLKRELEKYDLQCFIAPQSIPALELWVPMLEDALRSCDAAVFLVTSRFVTSHWTNQEVGMAIGAGKLVIPISIGDTAPGFLAGRQALPGLDRSVDTVAGDVFRLLAASALHTQIAERLLRQLARCTSQVFGAQLFDRIKHVDWSGPVGLELLRVLEQNATLRGIRTGEGVRALVLEHQKRRVSGR